MSRLGLLMDPRNQTAVDIEEIRAWREKVFHSTKEFFRYHYFLEPPLEGFHRKKGAVRLLKFTEPDGTVWYAEKIWPSPLTRAGDEERLREKALGKLSSEERAVLGFPDPDKT